MTLSLLVYFLAVVGLSQAQPTPVVFTGTLATALVVLIRYLWRAYFENSAL